MALIFYALAAPPLGIEEGKNQCLMAATKGGGGESLQQNTDTKKMLPFVISDRVIFMLHNILFISFHVTVRESAFLARCPKLLLRHFFSTHFGQVLFLFLNQEM